MYIWQQIASVNLAFVQGGLITKMFTSQTNIVSKAGGYLWLASAEYNSIHFSCQYDVIISRHHHQHQGRHHTPVGCSFPLVWRCTCGRFHQHIWLQTDRPALRL